MRSLERLAGMADAACRWRGGGIPVPLFYLLPSVLFIWFYLGTVMVGETNLNRLSSDQQYNIELARDAEGDWFPHATRGIVEPLWPWLVARWNAESDAATYLRGRWFNLAVCGGFMVAWALYLARRRTGWLPAMNLAVAGGFGALLGRAVYFQPEPLYYLLSFVAFALMLGLFFSNPLWRYLLLGVVCGLAQLAKSSIPPMMLAFAVVSGILALAGGMGRRFFSVELVPSGWSWRRHLAGLFLMAAGFAVLVAPRALHSLERFGDPFHSWPSYWMWQDDFGGESIPFMAAHGTREALETLDPLETPSLSNYLRTHSAGEVRDRLASGMGARMHEFFFHEGDLVERGRGKPWKAVLRYRGCYLAAFAGLAVVLAAGHAIGGGFRRDWLAPLLAAVFVAATFLGYWMAFGWYYRIGRGPRFMLGLYLPMLHASVLACHWLFLRLDGKCRALRWLYPALHGVVAVLLSARLLELAANPRFED